jgi:hypothetical protein
MFLKAWLIAKPFLCVKVFSLYVFLRKIGGKRGIILRKKCKKTRKND